MLRVLHYSATGEDNDPEGMWLDTLDGAWMSAEGKVTHQGSA